MAIPAITDFIRYINTKLTGANWNSNLQKIVDWFTDGNTDMSIKSLATTGDITATGDISAVDISASGKFYGDGSSISGLNEWRKNFIINGGCAIKNNADYTLIINTYGESVDQFQGMATGTAVSAGTLTQTTAANCGSTGYGIKFNGCTITGSGIIYLRHRIYSKSAVNFKNSLGSVSMQVYHNVGSSIPYTIYINKASALNDFTSIVAISDSGGMNVNTATPFQLKYENISFGDCTNGIEILIKLECGEITLKNFEFTELQLELGANITEFEFKPVEEDGAYNIIDKDGVLKQVVNTAQIVASAIGTTQIADNSITISKIAYGNFYLKNFVTISSGVNYYEFTGLNGNTDVEYKIVANIINTSTGAARYGIQYNSDTGTNYAFRGGIDNASNPFKGIATTSSISIDNIFSTDPNINIFFEHNFYAKTGYPRKGFLKHSMNTSWINLNTSWSNTTDNLTSIKIIDLLSSHGIGTGSRIDLYAKHSVST